MKVNVVSRSLLIVLLFASSGFASILNYEGLSLSDGEFLSSGYGTTKTVSVEHRIRAGHGDSPIASEEMSFWTTGYGSLQNVAWGSGGSFDGNYGEIVLRATGKATKGDTPDAKGQVTLNSFDLAGWLGDQSPVDVYVYDGRFSLLWSSLDQTIKGDSSSGLTNEFNRFRPGVSSQMLIIQWENPWGVAIDNVNFSDGGSANPVPEPATIAIWALIGLGGVVYGARRTKRFRRFNNAS